MEQGKLAKSTSNLTEIDEEQVKKPDFRNKVKKMQIDNITSNDYMDGDKLIIYWYGLIYYHIRGKRKQARP